MMGIGIRKAKRCGAATPSAAPAWLFVGVLLAFDATALGPARGASDALGGGALASGVADQTGDDQTGDDQPQSGLFQRLDANRDGQISLLEIESEHRPLFDRLLRTSDRNNDGRLSPAELAHGLTPSTPDKPIQPPTSAELRGARFGRLLLLKLDADRDGKLTREGAPAELRPAFDRIAEYADRNDDGVVTRFELNRRGPRVVGIGRQFAKRGDWDVDAELAGFKQRQGDAIYRFDEPIGPFEALGNPKAVREMFNQLDANGDRLLMPNELPERGRERFERLLRLADINRDGALSRKEYLEASQRLERFVERTRGMDWRPNRAATDPPGRVRQPPRRLKAGE